MKYLYLVILLCLFYGCNTASEMALNQAEVLMQEKPDSSLNILEQIDPDNLSRRKDKAKYALLYSQGSR